MKTKKLIFLLFSILCLLSTKMYAQGTNCSNAIQLSPKVTYADYQFQAKMPVTWFTFVATSAKMDIQIATPVSVADTPFVHIDSLILYSGTCGSLTLLQSAVKTDSNYTDSLPNIEVKNLIVGQTYYVKATRILNPGDESSPYFGLYQAVLAPSIIPTCSLSPCGPSLICNGSFESTPSWTAGAHYQDSSDVFHNTPPGSPENSYCISSPNMRYFTSIFGGYAPCHPGTYDFTDIYTIATNMGSIYFNNTAHSGSYFMGVDCPSNSCFECTTTPGACAPTLITTGYTCTAWQQTVLNIIPGATYTFGAWVEDMDSNSSTFGATVSMSINGGAPFFQDQIEAPTYATWKYVCYNWTAPAGVTSAKIQIFGQGTPSSGGYDFSLDDISFSLAQLPTLTLNSASVCPGGSATLTVSPAITGATYTWSTGATTSSITVSPTSTTIYGVHVWVDKCEETLKDTVTISPLPIICLADSVQSCPSACVTLNTACRNTPQPNIYTWSPATGLSATTGGSVTACPTGTTVYTVTATNTVTGCSATSTSVVSLYTTPTITTNGSVTCTGSCNGSVSASVSGGTGPFTYSWMPGGATTASVSSLCPGTYTVSVTDAHGCVTTATAVVIGITSPVITVSSPTICAGGSATICASGASHYTWSTGASTACITVSPTVTTTYSVFGTNLLHCSGTATATVTVAPHPSICLADSVTICPSSCTTLEAACKKIPQPGVVYTWAPATGLSATTGSAVTACPTVNTVYTVTATNTVTGCSATATEVVTLYPAPHITILASLVCAGSCNGTAAANVTGAAPFTYSWSGGQTTASIGGLCAGTYSLSVTDAHGCVGKTTVTIGSLPAPIVNVTSATVCAGNSATICASGNALTYAWNPTGATTACITVTPTVTTTYTVTGHNLHCSASATATVTVEPHPVVTATATPTCGKSCSGTATATVTGGTAPYTYLWATGGYTTAHVTGLCGGNYTVTVTDAHGCTGSAVVNVPYIFAPAIMATSATVCYGSSATICASGASNYVWSPTGATTACITVAPTVTTTYTVTGSNGVNGSCSTTATATVTVDHPIVTATATPTCGKTCSGTATATVTGGTSPYTYHWATGGYTTAHVTGLCGGNYTVTVTDAHGCTSSAVVNVPYIFPPAITATSATVCYGSSATICASGASSYVWTPTGATTACITVAPTVTTTYTVTGSNGVNGSCSATTTATVTVDHPTVTATSTAACFKMCNGTASATATGGTAPYTYHWATGGYTTASVTGLCGGNYTVTATDAHGCIATTTVSVNILSAPVISVTSATICSGNSATICASGAANYVWSPSGATTACITESPAVTTTYTVTGSNSVNGACSTTATGTITVNPTPKVCTTDSILVCIDHCAPLNALCNGNVLPNVSYAWTPTTYITSGANTASAVTCPTSHVTYTVTATNTVTGCSTTGTSAVFMFPFSNFAIHGPASVVCGSTNTYTITPNLPSPPVTYSWTAPTATPSSGTGPTATVTFNSPGSIDWIVSYPGSGIGGGCQRDISLFVTCGPTAKPRDGMENTTTTDNNVVVYPNPAGEVVNVQMVLQPNEQLNMCMYNNLGEQIKCETLTENISHISTSMLPAGIYFYRITNSDGTLVKSDKIMIVH